MRGEAGPGPANGLLGGLLSVVARVRPDADAGLISRAYDMAMHAHAGQFRKSGDPYIAHPVAVAAILAEAGADDETLCAALLHDAPATPGYSPTGLSREFGIGVSDLVTSAAELDGTGIGQPVSAGERRGVTDAPDPRALMIKLADRLHNLRTAAVLPAVTQVSKSRETLTVLVPLAANLGLDDVTAELQELATQTILRHDQGGAAPSARILAAAAMLLPAASRSRWLEEWAGELSALPTGRQRVTFAVHTLVGVPRLAVTVRRCQLRR